MFGKLSMDSLTTTMTSKAYRLWDTAKSYFAADSGQDNKDNYQTKTQDDEKASASLLSTNQQGINWPIPHPKKLMMLASLGLAYYTRQAGYDHNYDNQDADISYAINGMDFTSFVPFQTTSDWSFAIPSATGMFAQLAMLYGASNLLSQSYQYNAENLFIAPLSLMTLYSFLPILSAQTIESEFFKVFGGNLTDFGNAIKITSTGGIVVAGYTQSFEAGSSDAFVAKFYVNASLAWMRTLGGNRTDGAQALALTPNDDIVVAGRTYSFGAGNIDALVAKLYANGSLAWARALGSSGVDDIRALALTPSNDILLAGITYSFGAGNADGLVAKLDANGSLIWARTLGGSNDDYINALALTPSNDILLAGITYSFGAGNADDLVAKLDANGSLIWARTLGGSNDDYINALALTPSNDILLAGITYSFGTVSSDVFVAKLDATGSLAWARTLGENGNDAAYALAFTPSDDIVLTGSTTSFGAGFQDALVAKLYSDGSLAWTRTLGGGGFDYAQALAFTYSDNILVTGVTTNVELGISDVFVAKLDVNGTIPGCNLTSTAQPTLLNWTNITNTVIAPTLISLNTTGLLQNWGNISTQFITPPSLNLCFAQRNGSMNTPSSAIISTSVVSSASNSLTSNISPSSSQGSANSLTGTSSSVFSASTLPTSSILTSTLSASDINTSLSSTSVDATNTNNPSSASTSLSASQSSSAYSFGVSVSTTPLTIEQGISTTLTSSTLSVSGNVPPSQVIYTIIGNNPDIIITVNGLEVTQFTQEDVEGNFVAIAIPGVTCGDDYSTDLQLEANVAGSNAPGQQASVSLVLDITTCSYAERLSAFSYRDTYVGLGFWANNNPKERAEREVKVIPSTKENTVNSINFGH